MIRVAFTTLRADWRLWIGPVIVVGSTALLLTLVVTYWWSLGTPQAESTLATLGRSLDEVRASSYMLYVVIALSVVIVLGSNTAVTIRAQRYQIATLRLAGARPRQVRAAITLQVLAVSFVGTFLGYFLALPLVQPATDTLTRMSTRTDTHITAVADGVVLLFTLACTLVVCWLASFRPARIAAKTPAVAAVRDEPQASKKMGVVRWIGFGLAVSMVFMILIGAIASVFYVSSPGEAFAAGASNSITLGITLAATFGFAAPLMIPAIMRLWTSIVPPTRPAWYLARQSAFHRFALSSTTIVPLTVGFTLFGVIFGSIATWQTALNITGISEPLNTLDTYVVLTPVAVITGVGSVTNLFMTGRDRQRELALTRTAGARPGTLRAQVALEALIYVVTAGIVALIATIVTVLTQSVTYVLSGGPFAPSLDLTQFALLLPVAYVAMLLVVALPAYSASHKDLRSALTPA
ncbi:ABC transporter permease [Leucobacter viscericola]|uniref:ABC transporter permease n=1 Tax=Leucobacter viscericola TaxID=2714935 RepID=A0A6G7XGF6_9MICO|nr:ABC transporter permease [Leucobacter viscericola]QIK63458.1 ABC transporter permease [Leucobacter viscericola]